MLAKDESLAVRFLEYVRANYKYYGNYNFKGKDGKVRTADELFELFKKERCT